ncbi:MAG: AAA family ATPase [Proteobacteria bacterium]|nr:AAA family ATPase [Pseudomonadota bacterium]
MAKKRAVALGGFMATGKSTVGRALASRLDLAFVDLDEELERRFGSIPAQFRDEGEAVFRQRESALIAELCDGEARVLSTGGGAWVSPVNRRCLRSSYRTVVLSAPIEVLRQRVAEGGRPLWDAEVEARYESRRPAYADAELQLDAQRPVDALVEEIAAWLER